MSRSLMGMWFQSSPPLPEQDERRSSLPMRSIDPTLPLLPPSHIASSFGSSSLDYFAYDSAPAVQGAFPAPHLAPRVPATIIAHSHAEPHARDINPTPPLEPASYLTFPSSLASATTMPIAPTTRPIPIVPVFAGATPLNLSDDGHTVDDRQSSPSDAGSGRSREKEKRHACTMCHKAFDRPSTLRKHLLVHTGEKAFACDKCGRRFGVLSNLNRHLRKCSQDSAEQTESASATIDTPNTETTDAPSSLVSVSPPGATVESPTTVAIGSTPTRGRTSATVSAAGSGGASSTPRRRRTRRAPSPEHWVPESLRQFSLVTTDKACSVPLAPVLPTHTFAAGGIPEERDSYEEYPNERPYHPNGWRGRLPGPGLRDIISSGMSSMGRLVFF